MIIEKELFIYLFDICIYYKHSDFLLSKVFKILENIMRAKNEDIQDMVRYLIEDTPLIPFLINNGPLILEQNSGEEETKTEDKQTDANNDSKRSDTKSPEQSRSLVQQDAEKSKKAVIKPISIMSDSGI